MRSRHEPLKCHHGAKRQLFIMTCSNVVTQWFIDENQEYLIKVKLKGYFRQAELNWN